VAWVNVSDKGKPLLNIAANRTLECMARETGDRNGVIPSYLLQAHLCAAHPALHRITHLQRQPRIERCDDGIKSLRVELSTRLSFGGSSTLVPRKASENRRCWRVPYCLQGLTTMAGAIGANRSDLSRTGDAKPPRRRMSLNEFARQADGAMIVWRGARVRSSNACWCTNHWRSTISRLRSCRRHSDHQQQH